MDDGREELSTAETAPASPGEILRRRRESRNLSLEEAAEATSISKTYLRALEGDRFHDLPNPVYIKGFLRIYANYLGLPPDDLLEQLDDTVSGAAAEQPEMPPKKGAGRSRQWGQRFALPLILLAALLVSALILQPSVNSPVRKPDTPVLQQAQPELQQAVQPVASSSKAAPAPSAIQPQSAGATPSAVVADEPAPPLQQPKSGFVVRMKVLKNGTLMVTIDDAVSQNYQLNAGDLIEWKASSSLVMDLSDAGGVEFELNGKPLQHTGVAGKPSHLVLTADGIKR